MSPMSVETTFCATDCLYIGVWALIGSILGFFSFRVDAEMSPKTKIKQCMLSVGIGMLVAFPLTQYLQELHSLSKSLSMMLGAIGAFGLPDFILTYYKRMEKTLADKTLSKITDKLEEAPEEEIEESELPKHKTHHKRSVDHDDIDKLINNLE